MTRPSAALFALAFFGSPKRFADVKGISKKFSGWFSTKNFCALDINESPKTLRQRGSERT
jgi:hypothetical protein